jgi:hypothetical protein
LSQAGAARNDLDKNKCGYATNGAPAGLGFGNMLTPRVGKLCILIENQGNLIVLSRAGACKSKHIQPYECQNYIV